jgi:hypothetical protein
MRVCLVAGLLGLAHAGRAQDINATVAPNVGGSNNFVDIENTSGGDWYFFTAPTPAAASMSRMDSSEVGEYPWPTAGSFAPDPVNLSQNRIFPGEFLRVYPNTVAVSNVIQVEFSYSPSGTRYHFNVTVTPGAQVTSLNIIDPSPSAATIVHWRVTFDRGISGVTAANFAFANAAGLTNVSVTGVSADQPQPSTNWTITVNSGTGNGLLGLNWAGHASESPSVPNSFVGQLYDFSSYPIITLDPVGTGNRAINRNTSWTMTAAAVVRGASINYQWYSGSSQNPSNATAISGATNSSYTPPPFANLGSYQYFCHAYTTPGYYGNSLTATITVVDPPKIVTQPTNIPVVINQPATFSVGATGTSLQYQWFQGTPPDMSTPVGNNSPVLVTAPLTASTSYWLQITNIGPTIANSMAATATVIASLTAAPGNYSSGLGAAYPSAFAVTARDYLNNVASNVPVTFTTPSGAVPSGTFPGPSLSATSASTSSGVAVAPTCTADGVCGIYNVHASFSTLSAIFSCTNLPTFNAVTLAGLTNTDTTPAYSLATATGAQSPGGTFSGVGVSGGNFNPASAGRGQHVITYVVDGLQASFTITVVETPSLVVTTSADVVNPFDGLTSLREAVAYAATLSGPQTITFAPGLSGQTITLTNGEIAISNNLTIDASALANGVQINGNHLSSIFSISDATNVVLNSLTLTNGYAANGGAIVNSSTLTLNRCTLAGNSANGDGGAIWNGGPLTLTACTLVNNIANFAGAIQNYSPCRMTNCTLAGNYATNNGGAIDSDFSAVLTLTQCTFFGNSAGGYGGGVDNYLSTLNVANTILAGQNSGGDIYSWADSTLNTYGTNIVPVLYSLGTNGGTGAVLSSAPQLALLGNYGGPTQTMPPLADSPAIDAGSDAVAAGITTDQRGYPRVVGPSVDIGAVEYESSALVSNDADNGPGSLRYVITYTTNGTTIGFAPGLGGSTVLLTGGQIAVNHSATIDASTLAGGIQVNGNGAGRVFEVGSGNTVTMNSLTITNGYDVTGTGGGILNNGTLTLYQCLLAGNTASNPTGTDGFGGGGIYNQGAGTLTLNECTVANNAANGLSRGGGVFNLGTLNVVQSTISSNYANFSGGGIFNNSGVTALVADSTVVGNATQYGGGIDNFAGTVVVVQSTVVGNAGQLGGGGIYNFLSPATVEVVNSIVAANSSGQGGDIYNANSVTLVGVNIIESEYGGTVSGPSPINANPLLAPLGNYGGPTQTMPPLRGSPAINAGSDTAAAGISTDQRGYPRVVGASVDIGSVEVQIATTSPQLADAYWSSGNQTFQFSFTNLAGGSFTVFASTNVAAPLSTWTNIGAAAEVPPGSGQYHFRDPQATNFAQRFYIISSP